MILLNIVEEGWWRGKVGQKEGVFPINFVEVITEESEPPVHISRPAFALPTQRVDHMLIPSMLFIEYFIMIAEAYYCMKRLLSILLLAY